MVNEILEKDFDDVIKEGKVIVDCYAPWCGPCKMLSPIISELAKEIPNVKFYKLNMDEADEVSQNYAIMSIPTLLIFENGKLSQTLIGFKSKEELINLLK